MKKGWIVSVEDPEGDLLYVVATESPADAEEIVRKNLNLPESKFVQTILSASAKDLLTFKLEDGEMRGPM